MEWRVFAPGIYRVWGEKSPWETGVREFGKGNNVGLGAAERLPDFDQVGEEKPAKSLIFYFFPNSFVLAHVTRLVEVAKVLRERGHKVHFCGESPDHPRSKMKAACHEGFEHIPVKEYYFPYFWDRFMKYGALVTTWDILNHQRTHCKIDEVLDAQVQLIKRDRPDIVVGDGTMGLSTAAHIANVPAGLIINAYNAKFLAPSSPTMPFMRLFDAVHLSRIRKRVFKKHNCPPISALKLVLDTPMIAPDLIDFGGRNGQFPNMRLVGPIPYSAPDGLPSWYGELKDGTPTVYITMGSTGRLDAFLRKYYDALSKTHYRFVVTTAGQVNDETIAMAPKNFRFADFAPGDKILEHAAALIYHGGTGTMYQALIAGVPMLAFPFHLEQLHASSMVEKEGYGIRLSLKKTTGEALVKALERILSEPEFRTNAERISTIVNRSNGTVAAADILEKHAYSRKVAGTP